MNPPIWLIYNRGGNSILIQRGKDSSINRQGNSTATEKNQIGLLSHTI